MPPIASVPAALLEPYLAAQLAGDQRAALHVILDEGIGGGIPAPVLIEDVLRPAQVEIGRRWQENRITVAQEHLATAITQLVLSHLYSHLPRATGNGRRLVVACAEGERHELGARMAADTLEMAGFDVRYLGASVPADALVRFVVDTRADGVVLSAATTLCFPSLREAVAALRAAVGPAFPILVGGGAFIWTDSCGIGDEVIHAGHDAGSLVRVARAVTGLAAEAAA